MISALAIPPPDRRGKAVGLRGGFRELRPGGIFVNAEHVLGETPAPATALRKWHRRQAFEKGLTESEWADTVERMSHDHLTPLSTQLGWLRDRFHRRRLSLQDPASPCSSVAGPERPTRGSGQAGGPGDQLGDLGRHLQLGAVADPVEFDELGRRQPCSSRRTAVSGQRSSRSAVPQTKPGTPISSRVQLEALFAGQSDHRLRGGQLAAPINW